MNEFSSRFFYKLHLQLKQQVLDEVVWIKKNFKRFMFDREFFSFLTSCKLGHLKDCSLSHSVYFLSSLSKILKAKDLTDLPTDLISEDDLADFWSQTDLADYYFETLKTTGNAQASSLETLSALCSKARAYFCLHIAPGIYIFEFPISYPFLPNIGDSIDGVYALDGKKFCLDLNNESDLLIKKIDWKTNTLEFIYKDKNISITGIEASVEFKNSLSRFQILPTIENKSFLKTYLQRSQNAINLLSVIDSDLLKILDVGTKYIIPMHEENIVSYSMQELPLYSTINYDFRNFVDHIDDLLHENGHHLLNLKLNTHTLVIEDLDSSYYSPWRRALRPARGIYHAFITFFWAHRIFRRLFEFALILNANGTEVKEFDYIVRRYIEENTLLKYCIPVLNLCIEDGKISIEGEDYLNLYIHEFYLNSDLIDFAKACLQIGSHKELKKSQELEKRFFRDLEYYHSISIA
ncbi:MAG: hypothetical protein OHK0056_01090 [Bacteriovoracaceae bacterium]